jgi:uroporphyrinogen decarboxylase
MTPRERVLAAVELQEPDRVPIDIGGSSVSTIIGAAYERLKSELGVIGETEYMKRKSRSAILDERVATRLHTDTRPLTIGKPDAWDNIYFEDGAFEDEFHIIWRKPGNGHFAPLGNPLRDAETVSDIEAYEWPDPLDPGRTRGLRAKAQRLHEQTDYAVVLSLPSGVVHLSQYLRGYEQWLLDVAMNADLLEALLDRTVEWWNALAASVLDEVGPYIDVVMFGDDVAMDDRPLVDLPRYRRFFKPRTASMVRCITSRTTAKVLYHCCGAVRELIDEFIDIGIDALNPVQVSSAGMRDTAALKRDFGDRICFWGGVDTRRVLPQGTPEEVQREVQRRVEDLGGGGGYVVASVHNIQEDVPPENILAMADAALEAGWTSSRAAQAADGTQD